MFKILGVGVETVEFSNVFAVAKLTVVAKNNEAIEAEGLAEPLVCITQDPGLQAVCLNHWVLQTAWYQAAVEGPL